MAHLSTFKKDPILEYEEDKHVFLIDKTHMYIKPDKSYWLFPGVVKRINLHLQLAIPQNCIGLITKSNFLNSNIQLDTKVIHDTDGVALVLFIEVVNRGWLPKKLSDENIIAELLVIPKTECHIVNMKGQS